MAVTWTPFANGVGLLTLRNAFNTFNSAVQTNISAIEADIVTLGTEKIAHAEIGILSSVLVTPAPISLTTLYAKIKLLDTVSINHAHGHMTHNTTTNVWTVNTTGHYTITYSGSMIAPNGAILTFNYNINGASAITTPPEFVGRGTSPVAMDNYTLLYLTAGATLYVEAKADSAITMTPQSGTLVIEKTPY